MFCGYTALESLLRHEYDAQPIHQAGLATASPLCHSLGFDVFTTNNFQNSCWRHMSEDKKLKDQIRNAVTAKHIQQMSEPGYEQKAIAQMQSRTDAELDLFAKMMGFPTEQYPIYRDMMRGKDNEFHQKFDAIQDQLEIGDIILVTGKAVRSKVLAASQKVFYANARASHVVVVHADFLCIDSAPGGVSNRTIIEVLENVEANWRVIRLKSLTDEQRDVMLKKCAYYLQQPYMILPNKKPMKNYSYCSELARKIYVDCNIQDTFIPKSAVVKPCDFDRLADLGMAWEDVTEKVRPFIEFSIEYKAFVNMIARIFVNGLKLNQSRSDERAELVKLVQGVANKGKIPQETATDLLTKIKTVDSKMNYQFWNSQVNPKK